MMSPSRRRLLLRIWMLLSVLLFAATCVDRVRPYLKTILHGGAKAADRDEQPEARTRPGHPAQHQSLRVASWNMQFLDLPGRGPDRRGAADYQALARYAKALDAHVIAVQEVASVEALALVFPKDQYAYYLAERGGVQRSGFVYKKRFKVVVHPDLSELSLSDLRAGADIGLLVEPERELRMLSLHLKAFCVTGALTRDDKDCRKLNAQVPVLEAWIDARAREGVPFVVLGDFNRALAQPHDALFVELDDHEPATLWLTQAGPHLHSTCGSKKKSAVDHVILGGAQGFLSPSQFEEMPYSALDREAGRRLSDHCPIRVTLTMPTMR
jgi:endonuclease/exonuclease/phosphatase family metal-dependent hydrolase